MTFWGKLSVDRSSSLSLADHCIDVASVFRALCDLPAIERSLGIGACDITKDRLAVFALLHDLGKCNCGFQAKRDPDARDIAGHVTEVAPLLYDDELRMQFVGALRLADMVSWFKDADADIIHLLLASIFHHGRPAFDDQIADGVSLAKLKRHWSPRDGIAPFDGLKELGDISRRAFPNAFSGNGPEIAVSVELEQRFAGLVMLADWLGSHRDVFFPFEHEGDRIDWSRHRAKQALSAVGLDVSAARMKIARGQPTFAATFGISGEARPLQAVLASAELPPLLVAESDTGSGKTEAALMHFLALFAAGKVDALYFALPTRVAARELYHRACEAMQRVFGEHCPPVLLAVPGYAQIDGQPLEQILPTDEYLYREGGRRDRCWTAEGPKRFLAAAVAVGTIDQALFSVIQVPHAHLRAACLDRALLVIDEVHSSDIYMRYLARRLLTRHVKAGGHALLLSATLGAAARAEYLQPGASRPEPEAFELAAALPYPALSAANTAIQHLPDPSCRRKTVQIEALPQLGSPPHELLPRLHEAVRSGQRVLVILNTVARAITLARLADADPVLAKAMFAVNGVRAPHHGRFARADRELMDRKVTEYMGKASTLGPVLLIGTQTLEQSLDIDADWLLTDLCPIDVLLQRIGRLHRHDRGPRPRPVCTVLLPVETDFSVFIDRKGMVRRGNLAGLGSVYEDLRIVQLTHDIIAAEPAIEIPRDNRVLVETATHPERLALLKGTAWNQHAQHIEGIGGAQQTAAHNAAMPEKDFGCFVFPPIEERLATRLGLNDHTLTLGRSVPSPFGQTISDINIPGHLAPKLDIDQAHLVSLDGDTLLIQADAAGQYRYRYSRFGLEKTIS